MDGRRKSTRPQFCDFWYIPNILLQQLVLTKEQ